MAYPATIQDKRYRKHDTECIINMIYPGMILIIHNTYCIYGYGTASIISYIFYMIQEKLYRNTVMIQDKSKENMYNRIHDIYVISENNKGYIIHMVYLGMIQYT